MKNSSIKLYKNAHLYGFLAILVFSLSACSTVQVGHDFDVNVFNNRVKPGVTTKAQVQGWLGQPVSSGLSVDKDGVSSDEWMYFYGTGVLPKMDKTKIKVLQIRFDKNGRISTYNWSKSKE